jgi:hypothetical protein
MLPQQEKTLSLRLRAREPRARGLGAQVVAALSDAENLMRVRLTKPTEMGTPASSKR